MVPTAAASAESDTDAKPCNAGGDKKTQTAAIGSTATAHFKSKRKKLTTTRGALGRRRQRVQSALDFNAKLRF
jgi:hypothetical protein